jgi:hypothetical protein
MGLGGTFHNNPHKKLEAIGKKYMNKSTGEYWVLRINAF